jgi:hypothetical protein
MSTVLFAGKTMSVVPVLNACTLYPLKFDIIPPVAAAYIDGTLPAGQSRHDVLPNTAADAQLIHTVVPDAFVYVPREHSEHTLKPKPLLYDPAGQDIHPVAAELFEYVPGPHCRHTDDPDDAEYEPAGHWVHMAYRMSTRPEPPAAPVPTFSHPYPPPPPPVFARPATGAIEQVACVMPLPPPPKPPVAVNDPEVTYPPPPPPPAT